MAQALQAGGSLLNLGTTLAQGSLERSAGRMAKRDANIAAKQEELGAIQREADRKERLIEALATQNARVGASGIAAFEGSPITILEQSLKTEETATERDKFMTELRAMSLRARGRLAKSSAKTRARISMFSALGKTATSAGSFMAGGGGAPTSGLGPTVSPEG